MSMLNTTIIVSRKGMGEAAPELQEKLIITYFKLLDESNTLPAIICFYAEGVHLVLKNSPLIDSLKSLESKGVHLILCNTCLNFYGISDQVGVGIIGGMTDIIEAQRRSEKIITI